VPHTPKPDEAQMKKILLLTTLVASMSASAFPTTDFNISDTQKRMVKYGDPVVQLSEESVYFLDKASKNKYSDIVTKYHKADKELKRKMRYALYESSKHNSDANIAANIDSLAVTYLKHDNARMVEYWTESVTFNNMLIYQNDSLIDLERINIPMMAEHVSSSLPNKDAARDSPMTSLARMMYGWPAVGPDNKNIVVCRMTYSDNAAYYEMSRTDAVSTLTYMNSGMSFNEACLNHEFMKSYWVQRKAHFVDKSGDRKPTH
jgi:hypothetical protein